MGITRSFRKLAEVAPEVARSAAELRTDTQKLARAVAIAAGVAIVLSLVNLALLVWSVVRA